MCQHTCEDTGSSIHSICRAAAIAMRVPAAFILTVPVTKVLLITERVNAECDVELEWADLVSEYPEACAVQKEVSKVSRQR